MHDTRLVITIGSANGERILPIEAARFNLGAKHSLSPQKTMAGGSAVNHACRLLAQGIEVFPILPAADDRVGNIVLDTLIAAAQPSGVRLNSDDLFMTGDGIKTPYTTVLAVGGQLTTINEFPDADVSTFARHWRRRLDVFDAAYGRSPDAVVIGHIHADRDPARGGQGGGITQSVIERFAGDGVPIFANFGRSQYALGVGRWEPLLDRIACFQLDIEEMREFGAAAGLSTLEEILDWFHDRCTVVVTMERMGAVAQLKGSGSVVIGSPYDLRSQHITDPTGAGDAFVAGVVASALSSPLTEAGSLKQAVESGMLWSAYACTTIGGAADCPGAEEIESFHDRHSLAFQTELRPRDLASPLLRLLDRVFTQ